MNGISLNFTVDKFEKQFNKDCTKSGKSFAKGYIALLFIELVVIGLLYSINRNSKDLVILTMTISQLVLALFQRYIILSSFPKIFNLFIALQNIAQALLNCVAVYFWMDQSDIAQLNNFSYGANIILKHIYLLQGSSFMMKIFTAINISTIYQIFFINIDSRLTDYIFFFCISILLNIYKIYQEDLSLRNLFLVQRSEDEMNFLVKRLLPVSMLITRYDKKEERIYYHMSNNKLQKQFQIKDDESMKNFILKVELQALNEYQRIQLENNHNSSLFQHLHLQALSCSKKHYKNKQQQHNTTYINHQDTIINQQIDPKQSISNNNSLPNSNPNQHALFSIPASNQGEDLISPHSLSNRQSIDLLSHRNTEYNLKNTLNGGAGYAAGERAETEGLTLRNLKTLRKKEHKKTKIRQFDNLTIESGGDRQYEQTVREIYNNPTNANNNYSNNNQPQADYMAKKTQNLSRGSVNVNSIKDEIYDRLEVFYGILQGDSQKILNIKIYTYILEEIYQVIIFEDETLQGKVEYLTKLNKYYLALFEQMLKKLRAPIAQSLYKMKKAVNNLKQTTMIFKQQQSMTQNLNHFESNSDLQINPLNKLRDLASDGQLRKSSSHNFYNSNLQSTLNYDSSRASIYEDILKQDQQSKETIFQNTQDLHYNNYNILNNLFNYSDLFKHFSKSSIVIQPINISLERIIKDLKTVFMAEYKQRSLELYFISDLQEEDSYINTDEKYLKQVFINLINNSLQSLTKVQKGINPTNDSLLDISIIDTGPGFEEDYHLNDQITIQYLNMITLQKNLKVRELKLGIPISQKIIGKLGPYEKIKFEKSVVKFSIFRDYNGLIKNKDQNDGYVKRKSLFIRNKTQNSSEDSGQLLDDENTENQQNEINYAIQKQQIQERNEMMVFGRHCDYFVESPR